jgi:hypothetical protein
MSAVPWAATSRFDRNVARIAAETLTTADFQVVDHDGLQPGDGE